MIEKINKYSKTPNSRYSYSIFIPTWNNLNYLKLCISSLRKNSSIDMQFIVFVNEGNDGTLDWLNEQNDIDYIHATENLGICYGMNLCRSMIKSDYIIYLNDDMYALPNWDIELDKEIKKLNTKLFILSSTLIEPHNTGNQCVVVNDFGDSIQNFKESKILEEHTNLSVNNWNGSTWPPNVVHIDLWDLVGGLSVEFSPGMYSDPDFSKKLYDAGVRIFKGVGSSLVYHFGSKSTGRIKKNRGRNQFIKKWGMTANFFTTSVLNMGKPYSKLSDKVQNRLTDNLTNKIKSLVSSISNK